MDCRMLDIRIGTLVHSQNAASYIKQIIPYGFESFSISFGRSAEGIDLPGMAAAIKDALGDSGAIISSLSIYGNPLENLPADQSALRSWELLIDNAACFGTDIVSGFAGRIRGLPIDKSIDRFREVFTPLARKAQDKGVKLAFENCDMGGNWERGDWNIALFPEAWELMFDAVPFDNIGLEWEPCHQMVKLIDPVAQLRNWVGKIFHIHGKDATVKWDIIHRYGIGGPRRFAFHRTPGFGDSNWADIISELRTGGFRGSIDIEGWHDPVYRGELEMTGQVHALEHLKYCRGGKFVPNPEQQHRA